MVVSGIQRQPVQKHNTPGSIPDTPVRNGSSFKMCLSGNKAAACEVTDMSSSSTIRCGRHSQNCQKPIPNRGLSAHLAAWQKQQSPSACAANNGRSFEGLALPIRQLSTRVHTSKGELRTCPMVSAGKLPTCDAGIQFFNC